MSEIITQARNAILSRNESVAKAFVERTEDGTFAQLGREISAKPLTYIQAVWAGYEAIAWSVEDI